MYVDEYFCLLTYWEISNIFLFLYLSLNLCDFFFWKQKDSASNWFYVF